jgi:hypothetical protein
MISLPKVTQPCQNQQQQQTFQNTPDFTAEDEKAAALIIISCSLQSAVGFQNIPSATKQQCDSKMVEFKNKCILNNNIFSMCAKSTTTGTNPIDTYLQREGTDVNILFFSKNDCLYMPEGIRS